MDYKQAYAVSVISVFNSVTVAIGPTIGAFAISYGGWKAIFLTNLPFLLVSFFFAWFVLPQEEPRRMNHREEPHLDLPGVLLFTCSLVFLLLFVLSFQTNVQYVYGLLGGIAAFLFLRRERSLPYPFIDFRLFQQNRTLLAVNVMFVLLNVYNFSLLFGLPTLFRQVMGVDMKITGLLMFFIAGFAIVISPLTGKWIDHAGVKMPLFLGSLLLVLGALLIMLCFRTIPLLWTIPVLSLIGFGYGLQNVGLQAAMLQAAPPEKIGIASGLFQTSRYMGAIVSSVLLGMMIQEQHFPLLLFGVMLLFLALFSVFISLKFRV